MPRPAGGTVLSVIIPARNQWQFSEDCLRGLRRHTPGNFFQAVFVDNGSSDETRTRAPALGRELFGECFTHLRFEDNRNFGPGCNAGAKQATGGLLLFLNNDTVPCEGWLPPLLRQFQDDPSLGAAGPLCLYPDQRVQHLGIGFDPGLGLCHPYSRFPAAHPAVGRKRTLQAITGAAFMIPKALFQSLGGFHEGYANGLEDLDLCCAVRGKGKRLACVPRSRIIHLESMTPGRFEHEEHNTRLFNDRCLGCFTPDLHRWLERDGFALALTDWLAPYAALPPERARELGRATDGRDGEYLREALEHEPLWEKGYFSHADLLEAGGEWERAKDVLALAAHFFPSRANYARLRRAAVAASDRDLAARCDTFLARADSLLADPESLARKARALRDWARKADQPTVESLYNNWLRQAGLR